MTSALLCFGIIATLFAGWRVGRRVRFFLHIFQLETYKFGRYGHWLAEHVPSLIVRPSHGAGAALLLGGGLAPSVVETGWGMLILLLAWTGAFISSRRYRSDREKTPLAFTDRMVRLVLPTALLALLPIAGGGLYGWTLGVPTGVLWYLGGLLLADLGAPVWVGLGAALVQPVETAIQRGFKRQARRRLQARPDLSVVGITGSYGKTSTKVIVAELLRQTYNVYATPSSYNTPMGLCLAINEHVKPEHQVLVLEYGIRYPGDMDELCNIAEPDASVVTTVGVAHLETMKTQDNIAAEKGGLVERTASGGPAVLNVDDERVAAMAERAPGPVWRVSTEGHPDADIAVHDIQYDTGGTAFDVTDDTGTTATFETQLLGRHNVLNVLLAVAVGRSMGLRLRQMAHAIRRVEPIEHRLQLRSRGGVTIIDDAFNSNPVGARNAVGILGEMGEGQRVIVTPGMVELGDRQWTENKRFGHFLARPDLDLVVLVGEEQTAPIQEGLSEAGAPEERVKVVSSLAEAQEVLKRRLTPGDVVLYENDLPDQYSV
ncbi:UDP-N-acetylmuramoyl-tripeptide--D-alanyl-D-alanine ligase [Salinibacter altiplanensis]|uniref:UDP-N-acetylmuramoyl-tripeptide--D-alanyl-D- alanine ligase n=1 Tax=Salinibacter altiplanensis TaxID=1803181 RepID=UPI000C9F2B3F|nr:UDP-N-acetylmuramoyl-tripeptide--D-alanyl-D-alanine ligase [Salinibacter altiplanensis]